MFEKKLVNPDNGFWLGDELPLSSRKKLSGFSRLWQNIMNEEQYVELVSKLFADSINRLYDDSKYADIIIKTSQEKDVSKLSVLAYAAINDALELRKIFEENKTS